LETRHLRRAAEQPAQDKDHQTKHHQQRGANETRDHDECGNDETNDGHAFKTRHKTRCCKAGVVGNPAGLF